MRSVAARSTVIVEVLLRRLSVPAKRRGEAWWACCPLPGHADQAPSWSIIDQPGDPRHGSWYCFGCGRGGGPVELVQACRGLTWKEARSWVESNAEEQASEWQAPVVEVASRIPGRLRWPPEGAEPCFHRWSPRAQEYWTGVRGMPMAAAERYSVAATDAECLVAPRSIVFPVVSFGALRTWVARSYVPAEKKHDQARRSDGAQPDLALWGEPWMNPEVGPALVCEGIFDAMSLAVLGYHNAVALLGASAVTPAKVAAVARCAVAVVCTDADEAGDRVADELRVMLARHCRRVGRARPPEGHDWGSAPVADIRKIVTRAVEEVWP